MSIEKKLDTIRDLLNDIESMYDEEVKSAEEQLTEDEKLIEEQAETIADILEEHGNLHKEINRLKFRIVSLELELVESLSSKTKQ